MNVKYVPAFVTRFLLDRHCVLWLIVQSVRIFWFQYFLISFTNNYIHSDHFSPVMTALAFPPLIDGIWIFICSTIVILHANINSRRFENKKKPARYLDFRYVAANRRVELDIKFIHMCHDLSKYNYSLLLKHQSKKVYIRGPS